MAGHTHATIAHVVQEQIARLTAPDNAFSYWLIWETGNDDAAVLGPSTLRGARLLAGAALYSLLLQAQSVGEDELADIVRCALESLGADPEVIAGPAGVVQ